MTLEINLEHCQQLRALGVVDVRATFRLGQLSVVSRNRAVKYLREGWIRTTPKSGVGLLLHTLMGPAPVWHLRGATKHRYILWYHGATKQPPEGMVESLSALAEADRVASKLSLLDVFASGAGHRFVVLKPEDHVPQILAPYVATAEYQAAVQPLIDMIERGDDIKVSVRKPRWNGNQII